jgi:hypothetical protein
MGARHGAPSVLAPIVGVATEASLALLASLIKAIGGEV